jgi:hypothetical protein
VYGARETEGDQGIAAGEALNVAVPNRENARIVPEDFRAVGQGILYRRGAAEFSAEVGVKISLSRSETE